MSYEFLKIKVENGVGIITLNRPPANSLNKAIVAELDSAFDEIAANDNAKVLVINSEIPGFFIAGADIKMFTQMTAYDAWEISGELQRVNQKLEDMPKLTIAALGGYALGGGLELAMACDFRFMAESVTIKDKTKVPTLGLPETTLGILPGAGDFRYSSWCRRNTAPGPTARHKASTLFHCNRQEYHTAGSFRSGNCPTVDGWR